MVLPVFINLIVVYRKLIRWLMLGSFLIWLASVLHRNYRSHLFRMFMYPKCWFHSSVQLYLIIEYLGLAMTDFFKLVWYWSCVFQGLISLVVIYHSALLYIGTKVFFWDQQLYILLHICLLVAFGMHTTRQYATTGQLTGTEESDQN